MHSYSGPSDDRFVRRRARCRELEVAVAPSRVAVDRDAMVVDSVRHVVEQRCDDLAEEGVNLAAARRHHRCDRAPGVAEVAARIVREAMVDELVELSIVYEVAIRRTQLLDALPVFQRS